MRATFNVFHVSQLKKCLHVPEERVEARDIKLKLDQAYEEKLMQILDSKERVTQNRVIKFYKVMWSIHGERDATWEMENYL
jgi:RNA polymerase-interacting CarD/CdnL/TRCF family regulator